jgi:hypothetical protein
MYPAELAVLLMKYRHSYFLSSQIVRTHYGDKVDEEAHRLPHGTVVFSTWRERYTPKVVPAHCIPYKGNLSASQAADEWDDEKARWKWEQSAPVRGWVNLLEGLVKGGWLRPDPHLSYLIGKDTSILAPDEPKWVNESSSPGDIL